MLKVKLFKLLERGIHQILLMIVLCTTNSLNANPEYVKFEHAIVKSNDTQVTVLVTLKEPRLLESFMLLKNNAKDLSLDSKKINPLINQYDATRQQLTAEQSEFVTELAAQKMPFQVKRHLRLLTNTLVLEIPANAMDKVGALTGVQSIEIQRSYHTHLDSSVAVVGARDTWQLKDVNDDFVTGKGIRIAIIDTGIDYTHPDLGNGFGPEFKVVGGWDFANEDDDPMDDVNHGTHVAGIVAANGDLKGVAPEASLLAYKVFTASGEAFDSDIIAAMEKALDPDGDPLTDDGAHVINMSLGGTGDHDSPLSRASNSLMQAGVVVVVSAGNSGGFYNVGDPGAAEKVITVAATNNERQFARFSSGGPVLGADFTKPEISAPGVDIQSMVLSGEVSQLSGTSMAAPHVAGAAALLIQLYPELTSGQIKELLISSAQSQPGNLYGEGVASLDVFSATQKQLIISPALIGLGEVNTESQIWQINSSFQISNISLQNRILNLSFFDPAYDGVTFEILTAAQISLAPGEVFIVNYRLEVDNDKLPVSTDWPANYQVNVVINENTHQWQLPITFHKSHLLAINSNSDVDFSLYTNSDGSWDASYPVDELGRYVPVKSGIYTVFSLLQDDITLQNLNARPLIISERVDLTSVEKVSVDISPEQSEFVYGVNHYVDLDGQNIDIFNSDILAFDISHRLQVNQSDIGFSVSGIANLALNTVESSLQLSSSGFFATQNQSSIDIVTFAESWNVLPENHSIALNLNEMENGVFKTSQLNPEVQSLSFRHWKNEDLIQPFSNYWQSSLSPFDSLGFEQVAVYGRPDENFEESRFFDTGFELSLSDEEGDFHINTQPFSFSLQGLTKFEFAVSDEDTWITQPIASAETFSLTGNSIFWSATTQVEFQQESTVLRIIRPSIEGLVAGVIPVAPLQDSQLNSFDQDMPFTLFCDGNEISQGNLSEQLNLNGANYSIEASRDCDKLILNITYNNWLEGILYQSTAETIINASRGETALALSQVSILDVQRLTNFISNADGQIKVLFVDSNISSLTNFELEWKVGDAEWETLETTQADREFIANIPSPNKLPEVVSLRIGIDNNLGNSLINTLNGAFIYGTEDPSQLDSDDDGVVDVLDAFPLDPLETLDTDLDGIGNQADQDDDGDQMPDSFELEFNFDPLDSSDALQDADNDGLTNLEEYRKGTDPRVAEKKGGGSLEISLLLLMLLVVSNRTTSILLPRRI